jgi:hypothetical protein
MYQLIPTLAPDQTRMFTTPERSWYHESAQGNDRLLIVVGDSWTWGDSLGRIGTHDQLDDYEYRTTHNYGALLSTYLDADYLMLALPGGPNIRFMDYLELALPSVVDRYSKIDVVITLTELCREIIKRPQWTSVIDISSVDNLLKSYEHNMLKDYAKLFSQWPQVNFVLGRNFTNTYDVNQNIVAQHLPKTWVELLAENQDIEPYPSELRLLSMLGMDALLDFLAQNNLSAKFKAEMVSIIEYASQAIDWLDRSRYNNKKSTKHPTDQGHEIWAKYLVQYLR